jgi:hypothetical protein
MDAQPFDYDLNPQLRPLAESCLTRSSVIAIERILT